MRNFNKKVLLIVVSICIALIVIIPLAINFNHANKVIHTTGTVIYVNLEGGFFGIIGDDDENYDPINLSEEFESDGLRVAFTAIKREDMGSFHMWGILIELIDIQEL